MFRRLLLLFLTISTIVSCISSESEPVTKDNFDRAGMLKNIADNIIIPSFQDFSSKMNALKVAGETFTNTPNQTNIEGLRTSWLTAYKIWQHIEMFDIGKAEDLQYKFYMNVYPLTVADVESNISNGSYDLNSVNNHDAQGFSAIDYLLYGVASSDLEIISKYTSGNTKENYKKYLLDILNQMNTLTEQVLTDWTTSYRDKFVASTANTATSAANKLMNDYVFYFEKGLRANKFGIPGGVFSATSLPEKVEAFYRKDVSKELALEALKAVKNLFEGKHYKASTSGVSFKDYLLKLDRADISTSIINQFEIAKTEIESLNNSFVTQINTDNSGMTKSYDKLQRAVVFLKVDMLQAFNINVDYVDADGD